MSMPFSFIKCDFCPEIWATHMLWGLFSYLLPDGRTASIYRTISWCGDCNSFTPVERFPADDELMERHSKAAREMAEEQQRLHILVERRSFFGLIKRQVLPDGKDFWVYERNVTEAQASIDWKQMRKSGPKCLRCGTSDIHEKDLWEEQKKQWVQDLIHPGCGGEIKIEDSECRVAKRTQHRIYDVEGNFLREEDEPRPGS